MQKNLFEMWTKMLFQYTDNLTMFFPIFHNSLNVGLRSVMFTRWQMQYTERDAKQVLKTRFYFNYFTNRIYNKILDHDWFFTRLFVT